MSQPEFQMAPYSAVTQLSSGAGLSAQLKYFLRTQTRLLQPLKLSDDGLISSIIGYIMRDELLGNVAL